MGPIVALVVLAVALAVAAWLQFWPLAQDSPPATPARADRVARTPEGPSSEKLPADVLPAQPATVLAPQDFAGALVQFLGREAVFRFLETTDFPRRAVATLDNLAREHAPVMAWPVHPTPGRFAAQDDGSVPALGPENAMRYRAFVGFVDAIDTRLAVDLYRRMYPVLQREYRQLGFTDRTLHTRVFEVINLLLATPEPVQPPKLMLVEVNGPIPSTQPWTRYEFENVEFERLTAGQKMLLRVGPEHRHVLKAKLEAIRQELLRASTSASRP